MTPDRRPSDQRTPAGISDALAFLNRKRLAVDEHGCLRIEGTLVPLRVQGGTIVAIVNQRPVPWRTFREVL